MREKAFVQDLVAGMKAASKTKARYLGAEFEHFLVDKKTLRSFSYGEPGGQRDILWRLAESGWEIISQEEGNPLGVQKNGDTVTLEPGGQVEISLRPLESVKDIHEAYVSVISDIQAHFKENQALASIGYHPVTRIEDLTLLPKKRYHMMYDYFKGNGRYCHHMMKGTASTQVSIDYTSEEDFIKKFRVAHFLSPVIASIFDATPIFEGNVYPGENCRMAIWNETDIKRSKLIPTALDRLFSFEDYAMYILALPPILVLNKGDIHFTDSTILRDLLAQFELSQKDLEHILTMVFPDVRLKQYIEIRMADALPYPYNMAVIAMIEALFYHEAALDTLYERSLKYTDAWVKGHYVRLTRVPLIEDCEFEALKEDVFALALQHCCEEAKPFLTQMYALYKEEKSMTLKLKRLYDNDMDAFRQMVLVKGD